MPDRRTRTELPDLRDETRDEIAETERVLANLRNVQPWNDAMREKLAWQIDACQRHLDRMRKTVAA